MEVVADDQLRLMFLCCHPVLAPDSQVALTLRLLGGLQTPESPGRSWSPGHDGPDRAAKRKLTPRQPPGTGSGRGRASPTGCRPFCGDIADLHRGLPPPTVDLVRVRKLSGENDPTFGAGSWRISCRQGRTAGLLALMLLTDAHRSAAGTRQVLWFAGRAGSGLVGSDPDRGGLDRLAPGVGGWIPGRFPRIGRAGGSSREPPPSPTPTGLDHRAATSCGGTVRPGRGDRTRALGELDGPGRLRPPSTASPTTGVSSSTPCRGTPPGDLLAGPGVRPKPSGVRPGDRPHRLGGGAAVPLRSSPGVRSRTTASRPEVPGCGVVYRQGRRTDRGST